ncbi:MAG TPA: hypothetical protein VFR50_16205 [Casimicrobiaceae bacterium]|jgi:hypothetical protein|nr:hypothetical protein [Casimicrobiaceae bacterium]
MKRLVTVTALAAFGLVPLTAAACGEYNEAMATATPPAELASTTPAASKVPGKPVKVTLSKTTKPVAAKPAPANAKVAASATN